MIRHRHCLSRGLEALRKAQSDPLIEAFGLAIRTGLDPSWAWESERAAGVNDKAQALPIKGTIMLQDAEAIGTALLQESLQ